MGSSDSRVTDMDMHERGDRPDLTGVLRDPYNSGRKREGSYGLGVAHGTLLGIGLTLIVLAVTGTLVVICGG